MAPPHDPDPARYWFHDDSIVDLLQSVREFRRADQEMRRRVSADMDMNTTDLQALQVVIEGEGRGVQVTPRELSTRLGISTASTTKLLDRLTASGHLTRSAHPTDRRSLVLLPTPHAHSEVRDRLALMHRRMAEIAAEVPAEARPAVVAFLRGMTALLESQGGAAPLTTVRPAP